MESITNPGNVNQNFPGGAGPGLDMPPIPGLDRHVLRVHEKSLKKPRKNLRKTSGSIAKFFRYQNIYDYERPSETPGFKAEAESVQGAYSLRIASGGNLVELKRLLGSNPDNLGKHAGDLVKGYSRESRNRFIKLLLSIDYQKMGTPLFYTLTYPGTWSNDPREWKKNLDTFIKRMRREFPDLCGTWRLEPQKRGAPHFSGFLWGCDYLASYKGKEWFSRQWFEVVGSGDEKHLRAGTGISPELMIENRIFYLAKYQTKAEKGGVSQQFDYPVGRYWGVFERKKLALQVEEFSIDRALYFRIRRVMKKRLEARLGKNRFREAVKGKQNGLWLKMTNQEIESLLTLFVDESEPAAGP